VKKYNSIEVLWDTAKEGSGKRKKRKIIQSLDDEYISAQ